MRRRYLGAAVALALATALGVVALAPTAGAGTTRTYVVLYKQLAVTGDAAARVQAAGGTLVASYPQIGVTIARSSNDGFAATMKKDLRIQGVSATNQFGIQAPDLAQQRSGATSDDPSVAATWGDSLSNRQWDMTQIQVPDAHAINTGTGVLVGDIDTGIDFTNPDLQANIDVGNSANCVSGTAVQGTAAQDNNGHGTHTAGIIAAAANGIGIVGVAPGASIAAIKAGNADGYFFPEAVICAFMWAGTHGIDVTNNSYFADPWYLNCKDDPEQRAIWMAEQRAIGFAQQSGTLVIAAEGNFADDLAHPTLDDQSPDDTTPVVNRAVTNACIDIPAEIPGVVSVTASGNRVQKSFYSSYGIGVTDVIAPGGDTILFDASADVPNGRVLSTWPQTLVDNCLPARRVVDSDGTLYCYQQGTSMAAPHAVGVAALITSRYPGMSANGVAAMLLNTADPLACPDTAQYAFFPSVNNDAPQTCTGGPAYNSFNGHGQVNALTAVGG
jgi:lantibiotic leader peptide-processing serine protease